MSQNLPIAKKPKRRDSILKTRPSNIGLDDNAEVPKIQMKRRVSFHNVKTVQNFAVNDQSLLDGPPVKQKINETMGSDGVLTPGRNNSKHGNENQAAYQVHSISSHTVMDMSIADTTIHRETEVNSTMSLFLAPLSEVDSTMAMFSKNTRNSESPTDVMYDHKPVKFDLNSTRLDIVDMSMDNSTVNIAGSCDNTMAMFGKNNDSLYNKGSGSLNNTLNENTGLIFKTSADLEIEESNVPSKNQSIMEENTMKIFSKKTGNVLESTMNMFGANSEAENTMGMFGSNEAPDNTMGMFGSNSGADNTMGMFGTNTKADTTTAMFGSNSGADNTMGMFGTNTKADTTTAMFGTNTGAETTVAMFGLNSDSENSMTVPSNTEAESTMAMFGNNQNENTMKIFASKSFNSQNGDCDMDITLQGRNDTSPIKTDELASLPDTSPPSHTNVTSSDVDMDISDMNCVKMNTTISKNQPITDGNDTFAVFKMNNTTFSDKKGDDMEEPRFSGCNTTLVTRAVNQTLTIDHDDGEKNNFTNYSAVMEVQKPNVDSYHSMDISSVSSRKTRYSMNNTTLPEQHDAPRDVSIIQVASLADISQNSSMASISDKLTSYFQNLRFHPHTLKVTYLEPVIGEHSSVASYRNSYIEKLTDIVDLKKKKSIEELDETIEKLKAVNPSYIDAIKALNGRKLNAFERDTLKAGISLAEADWFKDRLLLAESLLEIIQGENKVLAPVIAQKQQEVAFCDSLRELELENNELEQKLEEFAGLDIKKLATIREECTNSVKEVRRLKNELHKIQMDAFLKQQAKMQTTSTLVKETSKFVLSKISMKQEAKKRIAEKVQLLKEELDS